MSHIIIAVAAVWMLIVYALTFLRVPFRNGPEMKWWERLLIASVNGLPLLLIGMLLAF